MSKLSIFVSSPGDVGKERVLSSRVINRMRGEFITRVELEDYYWEHEPMRSTTDFQGNIRDPSTFDIVICILWSRLGSRLNENYRKPDGSPYSSGTEYEFEVSVAARKLYKKPDILVYRNLQPPTVPIEPAEAREEKIRQYEALKVFLDRWFLNPDGSVRIAFNSYQGLEDFEAKLEVHLRKLISEKAPMLAPTKTIPVQFGVYTQGSPFRPLQAFEFTDAKIFFGRTKGIDGVLSAMQAQGAAGTAFTLIFGSSGSGKSSLVRAGVIPILVQPGVVEGIGLWRQAEMRPRGNVFRALAEALAKPCALPELFVGGLTIEDIANTLKEPGGSISLVIKTALGRVAEVVQENEQLPSVPVARLVLLIDQFEELFTVTDQFSDEVRKRFVAVIGDLAHSGAVWVVATLRSEFYGRCEQIPELIALKSGHGEFQLSAPTDSELGQIIRFPAIAAGLEFELNPQSGANLDDVLLDAARGRPGALPILEVALEELYQRRRGRILTHEAFAQMHGIEGALETKAEEVFKQLPPEVAKEFDFIFRALVTVDLSDKLTFTRRIAISENLATTPARQEFIDAFVSGRLFVSDSDQQNRPTVSIAHEALFEHWPRLSRMVEASQEFLRRRARAGSAYSLWKEKGEDASYLWSRGKLLQEARALLTESHELTEREAEFARTSDQAGKAARIKRSIAIAVATLVAVFAAFMGYRSWQQSKIDQQIDALRQHLAEVRASATSRPYEMAELSSRILQLSPGDSDAWEGYARGLLEQGDFEAFAGALAGWERNVSPRPAKMDLLRGDEQLKRGDLPHAIRYWIDYLKQPKLGFDDREATWEKLANAQGALGQWLEAERLLTNWIALHDNVHARILRVHARRHLRNWTGAEQDLERARELAPNASEVKSEPAMDVIALERIDRQIQRSPSEAGLWQARAEMLFRAQQLEPALDDIENAVKLEPDRPAALRTRAAIYDALNRNADAAKDRQRIKELTANQKITP